MPFVDIMYIMTVLSSTLLISSFQELTEKQLTAVINAEYDVPTPRLLVFTDNNELVDQFILTDSNSRISCNNMSFRQSLYVLLSCYYIAWINYPREFSQILGLLQQFVIGEKYTMDKGKRWIHFVNKLEKSL